jgi:Flp pilus assembly protein TadD
VLPRKDGDQLKQLEQERDELQRQLEAANRELYSRKGRALGDRLAQLEAQLAAVRAQLDVYEAHKVPFTPEELALLSRPPITLVEPQSAPPRRSVSDLAPASVGLALQAKRDYAAHQLDAAERNYAEVVRQNPKSVAALANLAAVQIEQDHLPAAETNILQAIALAPDDSNCLTVLGQLKFQQRKFDEALEALTRAAKLDPKNAEIQNFLGLALSEKGLRGPAETALRKALALQENFGSAHNNLAMIYVSQQPPAVELARWHYKKALDAGHPRNPELEKLLESRKP